MKNHVAWGVVKLSLLAISLALLTRARVNAQTLPQLDVHNDPAGQFATFQPRGDTPETGAFFQSLGTNGRTCATCHQPADAWGLSTADIQNTFNQSGGTDPLFAAVDGADCIDSTSHDLLLNHGLFRILLPIGPKLFNGATPRFTITVNKDPTNCQLNNPNVQAQCVAAFGAGEQCISVYRRPLPTTNLTYQGMLMWDGREPSPITDGLTAALNKQAADATVGHAQATTRPTQAQQNDMSSFESGLFTSQMTDNSAGALDGNGATESPQGMASLPFFFGDNASDFRGLKTPGFTTNVFTFFDAWLSLTGTDPVSLAQESIARGQNIFNNRIFNFNPTGPPLATCSLCHNAPNLGNNSDNPAERQKNSSDIPNQAILNTGSYLPIFAFTCTATGVVSNTTDPGRALIDGLCGSLRRIKVPTLHGLAARAPYFHNGSAPDLDTVVNFYNNRFNIGLSAQDHADLVNFMNAL
jgi:hypothetical protein